MGRSSHISALKCLIVLSLLSNRTLSFYINSSSGCEPCKERVRFVPNIYPEGVFVEYDLAESDNLKRSNEIASVIDVVFLPSPLFCVFVDTDLKVIVAGGPSAEDWMDIIEKDMEGHFI